MKYLVPSSGHSCIIAIHFRTLYLSLPIYNNHLIYMDSSILQKLIKPSNSLHQRLLLCKRRPLVLGISPHREPMLNPREEVNLPRLPRLGEDGLGLVTLLRREDGVNLRRRNGQRARDGREFFVCDKRRVGDEARLNAVFVVSDDVLNSL